MENRKTPDCIYLDEWLDELDTCTAHPINPPGVYMPNDSLRSKPFMAQGCYKSKKYNLGRFATSAEAGEVYRRFRVDPKKFLTEKQG